MSLGRDVALKILAKRDPHRDFDWTKEHPRYGLSMFPTVTSRTLTTGIGTLFGTAAYMAQEQACGKAVDTRADIWAFGCAFFEMLTGRRAFDGDEVSDVFVAPLSREPDWRSVPASVPSQLVDVMQRCLRKDVRKRLRDIRDARIALEEY